MSFVYLLIAAMLSAPAAESQMPKSPPAQICDFTVRAVKEGGFALLTWKGGTPPFIVIRGKQQEFNADADLMVLESRIETRNLARTEVTQLRWPYFYQVYDRNAVPEVFELKPEKLHAGQWVTVKGVGFSPDCAHNRIVVAGVTVEAKRHSTFEGLQFQASQVSSSAEVTFEGPTGAGGLGDQQRCDGVLRRPQTWQ